jgi:hypothetical protein
MMYGRLVKYGFGFNTPLDCWYHEWREICNSTGTGNRRSHFYEVRDILDFFGEQVGNAMFAFNVSNVDFVLAMSKTNGKLTHVDVAEFTGDGVSFGPVYTAMVVIPQWSGNVTFGLPKVLEDVLYGLDRLGAFIGGINFGLTGATADCFLFSSAAPG